MNLDSDIDRISKVIEDYGKGVFGKLDSDHVRRWLDQFDSHHDVLAYETANILEKYYITEKNIKDFSEKIIIHIKKQMNDDFTVIETQGQNKSQSLIVGIVKSNGIPINGIPNIFPDNNIFSDVKKINNNIIYLDDFVFSGNTLKTDFKAWLSANPNIRNVTVHILTIGRYDYPANTTINYLNKIYGERGITFNIKSVKRFCLSDNFQLNWNSLSDEVISNYICTNLGSVRVPPRVRGGNIISNSNHREIYETEMTKAGIKIIKLCREPNAVMKPLGYGYLGLGFGGTLFSYRNCPNTTPLAFWWGDPNPNNNDANHPFRKWYPLMQRIY